MECVEITAKTMLRRGRCVDSWFVSCAGMNLYRGCGHDCAYCDGRAEKYRVDAGFGERIEVKANAIDVLERELGGPARGQAELWPASGPRSGGYILLGGGVGDSYQPVEADRLMARRALELLAERGLPVHVLTKSVLVERDSDLLARIARTSAALVSFSLSTVDDGVAAVFEPGASPPSERLAALSRLRSLGIPGGIFLMPVLPFITDDPASIDASVAAAAAAGARYVVFGGMTLKQGRQKEHFLSVLSSHRPELAAAYERLYPPLPPGRTDWGQAPREYYRRVSRIFTDAARRHGVPGRIPEELYRQVLSAEELERQRRHSSDSGL
jgi:DNA repair photolyase